MHDPMYLSDRLLIRRSQVRALVGEPISMQVSAVFCGSALLRKMWISLTQNAEAVYWDCPRFWLTTEIDPKLTFPAVVGTDLLAMRQLR